MQRWVGPWTADRIPDQHGRTAVVTGANAGVGYHVAMELARRGATVVIGCRDAGRAAAAVEEITAEVPEARLEFRRLDLADLSSVEEFARGVVREHEHLDVLVNNAGLLSKERRLTADGFELMFGVNYLGHYALTAHLMPSLLGTPGSRIVMTSSLSYRIGRVDLEDPMFERRDFDMWPAYFQSKLAILLFAKALDRRLRACRAQTLAVCAHPGVARTQIGPKAGLGDGSRRDAVIGWLIMQPAADGALPTLRAATAPDVRGGELYGPRFVVRGPARRERLVRRGRSVERARALWDVSASLVGLEPCVVAPSPHDTPQGHADPAL
jgi:protochlorophyllide reductase